MRGLYCITAEKFSRGRTNLEVISEMLTAGVKIIQYREKEKTMLEQYRECLEIRRLTLDAGATFIINDHVDLALAVQADGVHLGQDDLPLEVVKKLTGEDFIIGISTHSPQQALEAQEKGADYIGVGPLFKTTTKEKVCEPVGLEYLDFVVKNTDFPFVAIGGIKEDNVSTVCHHGAECICLISEIVGAENIQEKIRNIKKRMEGEKVD